MTVFVIRRLLQSLLVMAVMSTLVFAGVFAIGNPIDILISPDATQAEYDRAVRSLGLDLPLWEQYWRFLQNLADGELGISFVHHEPAIELILQRMPATLELAAHIAKRPMFGLTLAKQSVNNTLDAMGMYTALQSAFGLHHVAHNHNLRLHGSLVDPAGLQVVREES